MSVLRYHYSSSRALQFDVKHYENLHGHFVVLPREYFKSVGRCAPDKLNPSNLHASSEGVVSHRTPALYSHAVVPASIALLRSSTNRKSS